MAGGVIARNLPVVQPDTPNNQTLLNRNGRYGENVAVNLMQTKHGFADEGSYFVATNGTPGTATALNANVVAFSDTNALFVIQNLNAASNLTFGASIYLDYLRLLLVGTAPATTVSMQFAFKKSTISREPTTAANRNVLTPANMRSFGLNRASIAKVMSYNATAAMTIPASVAGDPILGRCSLPTGLGITGDEYVVKFGGEDMGAKPGLTATRATDVGRIMTSAAPMIIDPGEWWVCHMWWLTATTNVANFEFELGWWER